MLFMPKSRAEQTAHDTQATMILYSVNKPGQSTHHGSACCSCQSRGLSKQTMILRQGLLPPQFTASLIFFMAMTFIVFDAGFALNTQGSFVKGFTPLRAAVAGLFFNFKLSMPASLKDPLFFSSSAATPMMPSTNFSHPCASTLLSLPLRHRKLWLSLLHPSCPSLLSWEPLQQDTRV